MPRPREFDHDAVPDTALDVFWDGGYTATSTDDLCERTGVGRSSLYNTFKSRRDLYGQALRRYGEHTRTEHDELLERSGPVREIIRDLLTDAVDIQLTDPRRRGCLALDAAVEVGNTDTEIATFARETSRPSSTRCARSSSAASAKARSAPTATQLPWRG